jgi:hypothetical protein
MESRRVVVFCLAPAGERTLYVKKVEESASVAFELSAFRKMAATLAPMAESRQPHSRMDSQASEV